MEPRRQSAEKAWGQVGWAGSGSRERRWLSSLQQKLEAGMSVAMQRPEDLDLFEAKGLFWRLEVLQDWVGW